MVDYKFVRSILVTILLLPSIQLTAQDRGLEVKSKDGTRIGSFKASYALVIGESAYTAGWPKLAGVKTDVQLVSNALSDSGFQVTVKQDLSSDEVKRAYEDFIESYGLDEANRLLFYYAGHGHTLKLAGGRDMGYIVPVDSPNPNDDANGFKRKAIPMNQFDTWAKQIEARHALFLFDSCFSGSIFNVTRAVPDNINEKTVKAVRQFITSGSADEQVPDKSIFRDQFLAGIAGEADRGGDGYVTGAELGEFLDEKVVNYSKKTQHPQYGKIQDPALDKGDFVFAVPATLKATKGSVPSNTPSPSPSPASASSGTAELFVTSNPDDAELFIDGKLVGKTGNLLSNLGAGRDLVVEARKGNLRSQTTVNLALDELRELNLTLEGVKGNLLLKAPGAEACTVTLDGKDMGLFGSGLLRNLDSGTYLAEVRGQGLLWKGSLEILPEKTGTKTIELQEIGSLELQVPSDAKWLVRSGGKVVYGRAGSGIIKDVPVGSYTVEVTGNGYEKATGLVRVSRAGNARWEPWTTGSLSVTTEPAGAEVYLNGRYIGNGSLTIRDLSPGIVELSAKLDGYTDWKDSSTVMVGRQVPATIIMRKIEKIHHGEIFINGGKYLMGSISGSSDEKPVHEVQVSDFWMMKTEVTEKDYWALMGNNLIRIKADVLPVQQVSWYDAVVYANKLSEMDGLHPTYTISGKNVSCDWSANGWRLPTEAEWEYAARGGSKSRGYTYAGGNDAVNVAWFSSNAGNTPKPVGSKAANELGLFDLSGNVWEWCWDWYGTYESVTQSDPSGLVSGTFRVYRGGSWGGTTSTLRSTNRDGYTPGDRHYDLGFRLVRPQVR